MIGIRVAITTSVASITTSVSFAIRFISSSITIASVRGISIAITSTIMRFVSVISVSSIFSVTTSVFTQTSVAIASMRMSASTRRAVSITTTMFRTMTVSTSMALLLSFITGAALFFGWFGIGGFFLSIVVLSTTRIEARNIRHIWGVVGAIDATQLGTRPYGQNSN